MIPDVICLSTDTRRHGQFIPLVCEAWRKHFPEVMADVVMVTDEPISSQYWGWAASLRTYPIVEGIDYANACKLARLYRATELAPDLIITINDMDLMPLQREFYAGLYAQYTDRDALMLVGEEVYRGNPECDGRAPMSAVTASAATFREILNPEGLPWPEWLQSFVGLRVNHDDEDPSNSSNQFSDEALIRVLIDRWNHPERILHVERGYNMHTDTIDRAWWKIDQEKLDNGGYCEAHFFKPLYHHIHRRQMQPLIDHVGGDVPSFYEQLDEADGDARRVLIIQQAGEHEENAQYREALCLQRAINRIPYATADVYGLGYDFDPGNTDRYDTIIVLEQYNDAWIPDLSKLEQNVIFWSIDAHKRLNEHIDWCSRNRVNLVYCSSQPYVEKFRAAGLSCEWLPNATERDWFAEGGERDGVRFIGSRGNRGDWIDRLTADVGLEAVSGILGDAMVREWQRTAIAWNRNEADDINYRTFEAMICGACVVTNRTPGIEALFVDGEEIILYDTYDECVAAIRELQADPVRTAMIAGSGQQRCIAEHTYDDRAQQILNETSGQMSVPTVVRGGSSEPLLALNIIVGAHEADVLRRVLESVAGGFDEIVIALTSDDTAVEAVAREYATTVVKHQWATEEWPEGHFANARNAALAATRAKYWMWLDADDEILQKHRRGLTELRKVLSSPDYEWADTVYMPYTVALTLDGAPVQQFLRERIFKRSTGYDWYGSVHEQIIPEGANVPYVKIDNFPVTHLPTKPPYSGAERNVRMLRWELKRDPDNLRVQYYLARDLLILGAAEGIERMEALAQNTDMGLDRLYSICWDLAQHFAYGRIVYCTTLDDLVETETTPQAERYARMAVAANTSSAEPVVLLGDLMYKRENFAEAQKLWQRAYGMKTGSGNLQNLLFYRAVPADRLAHLAYSGGRWEEALMFNRRADEAGFFVDRCEQRRLAIMQELNK